MVRVRELLFSMERKRWCQVGLIWTLLVVLAVLGGCVPLPAPSASPLGSAATVAPFPTSGAVIARQAETPAPSTRASDQSPTPEDRWSTLFQRTPYPYTTPLPSPTSSALDGTYVKTDPSQEEHVHCLRCPDYLPEGGLWKLNLDHGIFRIYYQPTGWRGLASFVVSGDRFLVFNDPNCPDLTGAYTWGLRDGELTFSAIEDECSIGLRAANLTKQPWLSCRPPNREAMITDHWIKPAGCE